MHTANQPFVSAGVVSPEDLDPDDLGGCRLGDRHKGGNHENTKTRSGRLFRYNAPLAHSLLMANRPRFYLALLLAGAVAAPACTGSRADTDDTVKVGVITS